MNGNGRPQDYTEDIRLDSVFISGYSKFSKKRKIYSCVGVTKNSIPNAVKDGCCKSFQAKNENTNRDRQLVATATYFASTIKRYWNSTIQKIYNTFRRLVRNWKNVGWLDQGRQQGLKLYQVERMSLRGANWNNGVQAAVAALNLNNARSNRNWNISSRLALDYFLQCLLVKIDKPEQIKRNFSPHRQNYIGNTVKIIIQKAGLVGLRIEYPA